MKIKEILPEFDVNSEIDAFTAVKIYKAIIMGGKDNPLLSDYTACPSCGSIKLELLEKVRPDRMLKATSLACTECQWQKIEQEWEYVDSREQEALVAKYGSPKRVVT